MSRNGKVIVAMSGGVDSSVAACLLKSQGYECVGVFMRVGAAPEDEPEACPPSAGGPAACDALGPTGTQAPARRLRHGCCSATDALDARSVANRLGIPFYALNFRKDFERIIDYFVDEYARARTPNPCVRCNIELKFGKLLRYADAMDAQFVATGHYARVLRPPGGPPRLARSANTAKDQSYVLFGVRREDIGRCLFPLGEIADKAEVRRLAAELGLRVHDKPDSQEICFVPGHDYRALLDRRRPGLRRPGELRDAAGNILGRHEGVPSYTIGQRRGLGVALGTPAYVTRLDVLSNTVTLGPYAELLASQLVAEDVNWLVDPPATDREAAANIKIRHMHAPAPGRIRRLADDRVRAEFATAQAAVTPGQAAVFYDEAGFVLGGGWIAPARD
ncbi:MAG: tRNA 2-thiouridine(34) synthase MnmA [Phycisphaerae bacterium]|nr:tRNA 2-thiouridine(34) synthase MnmA [Phycisphaerae bacterium]MCZ2400870.1 tRNA 2-thiouridine(34) synthase MnmA [Phycisphaerae bacterium]